MTMDGKTAFAASSIDPRIADRLAALAARAPRGMLLGLDRVKSALARLGSPEVGLPCLHIAGTNGKGSTAAMVESIARAAGQRTGLYTSPHLVRFAERIRIDGEAVADAPFEAALGAVLDRCDPELTFFESLTLAAFVAFRDAKLDVCVLEVGLGGRLDATNVIERPIATAITSIALDHTAILGDTLDAIAREKAGILKRGAPLVLGPIDGEARLAIDEVARAVGAGEVLRSGEDIMATEKNGEVAITGPMGEIVTRLGLEGAHQIANATVAAGLAARIGASNEAIARGLERVRWPGRLEEIDRDDRRFLLDCAHNQEGAEALARAVRRKGLAPASTSLVFGALADKSYGAMLREIAPLAGRRYYAAPKGRAPAAGEELARIAPGAIVPDPAAAIDRAVRESSPGDWILVTGSAYLVGEARALLLGIAADPMIAL